MARKLFLKIERRKSMTDNNNDNIEEELVTGSKSQDEKKATRKKGERKSKKIKELESLLDEQKKKTRENYDQMLRAMAELENYKKRMTKDKAELLKYGNEKLIQEILPVFDNLERATNQNEFSENLEGLLEGVKMTIKQFYSVLEKFGVEVIVSVEKKFDPEIHEAVMQTESEDHEANTVVSELERGYILNGRLLRPAKVAVSKLPDKPDN